MGNYKGKKPPNWKWVILILIGVMIQIPCILTFLLALYMQLITDIANLSLMEVFYDMEMKSGAVFVGSCAM